MGKPQNRLELRRQYDAAEPLDPMEDESEDLHEETDDESERRPKRKAKAKPRAKAAKTPKPAARMRIVWVVVNDAFKTIATFEYSQKQAAETKAAEMTAKGRGTHFVQKSKEPMPDNAPGIGAALPRPQLEPVAAKVVDVAPDDDEEPEEDEDYDDDDDIDEEED